VNDMSVERYNPEGIGGGEVPRGPDEGPDRAESGEAPESRDVEQEVRTERESAKEKIADVLWERPKRFVEDLIGNHLVAPFRKFLSRFSSLDDETLASHELRKTRDQAAKALEEGDDDAL